MKNTVYFLFLNILIPGFTPLISVADLPEKQNHNFVFLDTRSLEEYQVSHLKGAKWVGYEEFNLQKIADLDTNTTVVLYCSVGYRSDLVGKKLIDAGFQNVYNLKGGIFAWVNDGKYLYADGEATKQVHPFSKTWGFWLSRGEKVYKPTENKKGFR